MPNTPQLPLILDTNRRGLVSSALQELINRAGVVAQRFANLGAQVPAPPELSMFMEVATNLRDRLTTRETPERIEFPLKDEEMRIVRTALALQRRRLAEKVEHSQQHVTSAFVSRALDETLVPLNTLLDNPPLARVVPLPSPSLADFITAEGRLSEEKAPDVAQEEREPKHRILLSASLISKDVSAYRSQCEERRVPFAIVFADIDDFKKFNSTLGEVIVDKLILPPILSAVEKGVFGHGRAYRHGGDEFLLLLPNASIPVITSLVGGVKSAVESLKFDGTTLVPRLSAGVWITVPASHLTGSELVQRASEAKAASKAAGKSQVTIRLEVGSEYVQSIEK